MSYAITFYCFSDVAEMADVREELPETADVEKLENAGSVADSLFE